MTTRRDAVDAIREVAKTLYGETWPPNKLERAIYDRALEDAAKACWQLEKGPFGGNSYRLGCVDCAAAIRALKSDAP